MPKVYRPPQPYWQSADEETVKLYLGEVEEVLGQLPPKSVQCVVTSPPYYGLRDYKTGTWEGGDEGCDHSTARSRGDDIRVGDKQGTSLGSRPNTQHECGRCGAVRKDRQIGLEQTPQEYVDRMVGVFREVHRVLRDDGTLWLNLADSYGSGEIGRHDGGGPGRTMGKLFARQQRSPTAHKQLLGIPWRVALAMQADGWVLRSDIIWAKTNPMPESVTDRPTKAHEYLFMFAKQGRYYYDADAIREKASPNKPWAESTNGGSKYGLDLRSGLGQAADESGRNRRSVWTISTHPYPGAHFAVMPEVLAEPCVLAGTSEHGACSRCLAPWKRVVERRGAEANGDGDIGGKTLGWRPTCKCGVEEVVPCTVLDPFCGSATTCIVALNHGRNSVGIDLSEKYLKNNAVPRILGRMQSIPAYRDIIP